MPLDGSDAGGGASGAGCLSNGKASLFNEASPATQGASLTFATLIATSGGKVMMNVMPAWRCSARVQWWSVKKAMCMCVNTGRQTEAGVNNMSQFRSKYNGRGAEGG